MFSGFRILTIALLCISTAQAQYALDPTRAAPPQRSALDRLHLTSDWSAYIPVNGRRDGIALVQPIDVNQVFVQTKACLVVAVDAKTGRQQWNYKLPSSYVGSYPVAVNDKYVFVEHVARLYAMNKLTGGLEFVYELPDTPSGGPIADNRNVYIPLSSGQLVSLELPLLMQPTGFNRRKAGLDPTRTNDPSSGKTEEDYATRVAQKYATNVNPPQPPYADFQRDNAPPRVDMNTLPQVEQASPSISALHSVVPPYELNRTGQVASIVALPSLVQPYTLYPPHLKYQQFAPSITSASKLHKLGEQSSLRSKGLAPTQEWRFLTPGTPLGRPIMVESNAEVQAPRLWLVTEGEDIVALDKDFGTSLLAGSLPSIPLSQMVGPYAFDKNALFGFVALKDGLFACVDLLGGGLNQIEVEWRADVGGYLNHKPVVSDNAVYASGDRSGTVKMNALTGEVIWRTDASADQVLAANNDYVYIMDRRGHLLVYDANARPDRITNNVRPLSSTLLAEFNINITNNETDRIFLAADNGLVISLRDKDPKYAKPMRVAPPEKVEFKPTAPEQPMTPADENN